MKLQHPARGATRFVIADAIFDFDDNGDSIGMEVIGFAEIAGAGVERACLEWLNAHTLTVNYDYEVDVLTLNLRDGRNWGQRVEDVRFGFDDQGALASLEIVR